MRVVRELTSKATINIMPKVTRYPGSLIRVKYGCVKKQLKMRTESREEIKL